MRSDMADPECPYCGDPVEPAHVKTCVEREGGVECYHEACDGRRRADQLDAERAADKRRIAELEALVTEHPPGAVSERWAAIAYQHGVHDGCEEVVCFGTEDEANAYAREWASEVGHDNKTEHEVVVMKAVRTFRGPRTWADL
jgi:hypothetical protein